MIVPGAFASKGFSRFPAFEKPGIDDGRRLAVWFSEDQLHSLVTRLEPQRLVKLKSVCATLVSR